MRRRIGIWALLLAVWATPLAAPGTATAEIQPPWCGQAEPDAAEALDPNEPGAFPHIPYYAIECTLESIQSQSGGRMTLEVIGQSAQGRDLFLVTINALETGDQRKEFMHWKRVRRFALKDPARSQSLLERFGDDVKVPIFIQSGIHGNEYEGVDAAMNLIEDLATTPYGTDPGIDAALDHTIMLFNVIQNPDGRVLGQRANGNGFDLNRDYLTQSQPETLASVGIMQEWLATEGLDLHGYATPTLVDGTTKPHNPGLEYDLFVKWNQPRLDANEAALNAIGQDMQRPINDWCADTSFPDPGTGLCPDGQPAGPAVAEGWDDWGPFYTATYMQLTGVDASTVEMCRDVDECGGRTPARDIQYAVSRSTMDFVIENREDMLFDHLEIFRRGVSDAARPDCCPAPIVGDHDWMTEYPKGYVIPLGQGQRSDAEANRLVRWLLFNGIEVAELARKATFGSQTFARRSYVVWMDQALRGLADTALNIGTDISDRVEILYAPPASWSHGYLWGADVVTIPDGASFSPQTRITKRPNRLFGGVEKGTADHYALEIDSPSAIRALNGLLADGIDADLAMAPFATSSGATLPAGSAIFSAGAATALTAAGQANGVVFRRMAGLPLPSVEPIERVPRIAVLTNSGAPSQDLWALGNLEFEASPVATGGSSQLNNPAAADPLANVDVAYTTAGWPSGPTAQSRLTSFFNGGGGLIGVGVGGSGFAANSGQLAGLATTSQGGDFGESGIFRWSNVGGAGSPIVGAYPSQDTAIMDPPAWFSTVPSGAAVDSRLLPSTTDTFASGLWLEPRDPSASNAPIVVHGPSTAPGSTARVTAFSMNPLYRADPEREWPMVAEGAYWGDQ